MPIPRFADGMRPGAWVAQFRARREQLFVERMHPEVEERILDIGGYEGPWERMGLLDRVTVVNLDPGGDHKTRFVQADGTALPFPAGSFGLVYSNSVIEHVGDFVQQRQLAEEIRRVGKRYWVQAPSRSFPIEPHFLFPGFQSLPLRVRLWIGPRWPFSWPSQLGWTRAQIEAEIRQLRLPSTSELQTLFPEGVLYCERFLGLTKSLVAHSSGRDVQRAHEAAAGSPGRT